MDSKNQENRDAMKAERFGSSKDHFVAGVKGLGMGLVGGLTSLVTQPIEGAHNSGMSVSSLGFIYLPIKEPTGNVRSEFLLDDCIRFRFVEFFNG